MKSIKFSHRYNKFPRDFQLSKLLEVLPVKLEDLSLDFLLYDTSYEDEGVLKQYPLPHTGDYMILLLRAGSGHGQIWTTIRRRTPEKEKYYRGLIGEIVSCQVVE